MPVAKNLGDLVDFFGVSFATVERERQCCWLTLWLWLWFWFRLWFSIGFATGIERVRKGFKFGQFFGAEPGLKFGDSPSQ
ncbi:hypothetical protein BZY94_01055 [Burkholderia territorii]|nr:hypothetical protein BZY94_01055 [Burkholderia territorii]